MITKFKLYELWSTEMPEVGDYVILDNSTYVSIEYKDFVDNNIGEIIEILFIDRNEPDFGFPYMIKYDKSLPGKNDWRSEKRNFLAVKLNSIKYWSKNKEDLEGIIEAKKYNV